MHLLEYVERYISERDLSTKYCRELRRRARKLEEFSQGRLLLSDLTDDLLNAFLEWMRDEGYSPRSRMNYRDSICAVWRDAWESQCCPRRPERVKRIKVPKQTPKGWTLEEMRRLLDATANLSGNIVHLPISRRLWFRALVLLLWDTGIRIGDALEVTWDDVVDGRLNVTQSKTGNWICRGLSSTTMDALQDVHRACGRKKLLPYDGSKTQIWDWLGRAVDAARIRNGRSREIRRASSSYVEREHPGRGAQFLGHTSERTFETHYRDPSIAIGDVPSPPPLGDAA